MKGLFAILTKPLDFKIKQKNSTPSQKKVFVICTSNSMANKLWMGGGQKFYVQEECECNQRKGWFDKISIRRSSSDTSLPPGGPGKNCERPSSGNSLPIRSKSCLGPFSRAGRNIQESKISHIRSSEVPIKISYDIVSISSSPLPSKNV